MHDPCFILLVPRMQATKIIPRMVVAFEMHQRTIVWSCYEDYGF